MEDGSGEEEKGDTADEERVSCFACMLREDKGRCLRSQDTHQLLPLSILHMFRLCFILILKQSFYCFYNNSWCLVNIGVSYDSRSVGDS